MNFIKTSILIAHLLFLLACTNQDKELSSVDVVNWQNRKADNIPHNSLKGSTYLSVYSHIYSQTEHRTHSLTATVSIRNTNKKDSIYIDKAEYFNTHGKSIRTYFDKSIYIAPMETVEIIIDQKDESGGSGANFIFDWKIDSTANEPLFEAVMISTYGQQGLSFTTLGKRID